MEVVEGTEADRKGGHIARRRADGQLVLRETAQTPPEDEESFRDYRHWRYYNTNNLWVDLRVLAEMLESQGRSARAAADHQPQDGRSPRLELAIGPPARERDGSCDRQLPGREPAVRPTDRFVPVKTTDDLLVLRSDVYKLTDELAVEPVPERAGKLPFVELDSRFYKLLDAFEQRFPAGPPSLRQAERLVVKGDVTFGADVVVRGAVELETDEPMRIDPGTVLGT